VEFLHEKGRERTLSFDEERKYLKAAAPVLRDVAIIMVEMGPRPGEILSCAARMSTMRRLQHTSWSGKGSPTERSAIFRSPRERFPCSSGGSQDQRVNFSFLEEWAMGTTGVGP